MFKKSMAIILSILLLMSAIPAFAATVTDSTTGIITYTDDFNSAATGSYSKARYPSGTLTSDVFVTGTTNAGYHVSTGKVEMMSLADIPTAMTGNDVKVFVRFYDYGNIWDHLFYIYD